MKRTLFLFGFLCTGLLVMGQNIKVSGTVSSDSELLIGVNILVKGTGIGTISDYDGSYELDNVPSDGILEFSYVGYDKIEVPVNGQSVLNVTMNTSLFLEEVVVSAFGIEKDKKVLGYGSQTIKATELLQSSQPNLINALQGKVAGVTINSSGGAPGAGSNIVIRGINSLSGDNDNQPLIVVDGIIISNATNAGSALPSAGTNAINSNEQFMNTNRLADLNMEDIESLNILKGAAATALYGQRASNGALIITTKKGKAGTSSITYSASYGIQNVNKVPRIQETYYQGFTNLERQPPATVFWQFGPPALPSDQFYNHFRDFFETGTSMSHSLSFAGANDKSNFQSSFSYLNNDGIVVNSNFKRITGRVSASHQLSDRLNVGAQINYSNSVNVAPPSGDKSIFSSLWFWMTSFDINDHRNPDGSQKNPTAGIIDQPRYLAEEAPQHSNLNRVFGDINLNYQINDWLRARYQVTADFYNDRRNRVVPPDLDVGTQVRGFAIDQNINFKEINSNFLLMGEKRLSDDFNLAVTLGNNITDISTENVGIRGEGFVAPGFFNVRNTTNFFPIRTSSLRRIVGVFAEARLDYQDYLYLTLTGRNDWSSTLPADNRSFFYPSASISYLMSRHIPENDAITYLKLRGSVAQVGKDAPPYRIGNYFSATPGFPFGGIGGFTRDNNIGNFNLLPEITTETEVGMEARFFKDRVSLEANYFVRNSKNQILNVPISTATGYSSYTTNAGVIVNRGVEVLLGVTPIRGKFNWDIDFNWTRIRGRVESMPEDLQEITYVSALGGRAVLRIEEGGAVGDIYGFDFIKNDRGETVIFANGLPRRDPTLVKIGNALPDWFGGMNNTFSYKGLSVNVLFEVRHRGDVVDLGENNAIRNGTIGFTEARNQVVVWNGVREDGTPNAQQVFLSQDTYRSFNINAHQSYVIQDASWFRIRNASISYSLPKSVIGNSFKFVRLGVVGNNLFLSTPFRGYDPEALAFGAGSNLIGFTGRSTPMTRNFNFNVVVGF